MSLHDQPIRVAGLDLVCAATSPRLLRSLTPLLSPYRVRRVRRPSRLEVRRVPRRFPDRHLGTVAAGDDGLALRLPGGRARVDSAGRRMQVEVDADATPPALEPALRLLLYLACIARGGVPLHAAAVALGRRAAAFFGPSGQGKTTAAGCSGGRLLQEDLVLLLPRADRGWVVAAAPVWSRPDLPPTRRAVRLGALLRPGPGPEVRLRRLRRGEAAPLLFNPPGLIGGGFAGAPAARLLESCSRLAAGVPCGELRYPAPTRLGPELRRWLEQQEDVGVAVRPRRSR